MAPAAYLSILLLLGLLGANYFFIRRLKQRAAQQESLSGQLQKREALSRAILRSAPQKSELSDILADHLPQLFPDSNLAVWLFLDKPIFLFLRESKYELAVLSNWLASRSESDHVPEGERLPWETEALASVGLDGKS